MPELEDRPDLPSLSAMAEEAQRTLRERPSRSVRLRIAISASACR